MAKSNAWRAVSALGGSVLRTVLHVPSLRARYTDTGLAEIARLVGERYADATSITFIDTYDTSHLQIRLDSIRCADSQQNVQTEYWSSTEDWKAWAALGKINEILTDLFHLGDLVERGAIVGLPGAEPDPVVKAVTVITLAREHGWTVNVNVDGQLQLTHPDADLAADVVDMLNGPDDESVHDRIVY